MSQAIHNKVIDHYKNRTQKKQNKIKKVQSVVKHSLVKKINQQDLQSPFEDFLRVENHVAAESDPLDFRSLPRNLKVHFPGPPKAPPKLEQIPYTYELVPNVSYKVPKQKKGTVGQWVLEDSQFVQRKSKSVFEQKSIERIQQQHKDMTSKKHIFRAAIKKLAKNMRQNNLSLAEIKKNKGMIKKPFNYYNSQQFFQMIKIGDNDAQKMLDANPYLAFDVDDLKMTALHWAAREGHAYLVKILLQKFRANALSKDMYGRSPLHLAVSRKKIPCIIRIFIEGGQLSAIDNEKRSVRQVAPDSYTKFLLQKLEEVKFVIRAKKNKPFGGIKQMEQYREELQRHVKFILDEASLYF